MPNLPGKGSYLAAQEGVKPPPPKKPPKRSVTSHTVSNRDQVATYQAKSAPLMQGTPAGPPAPSGQIEPGNIDIHHRPIVHNKDGTISTVRSITIQDDRGYVVIPTVVGHKVVSDRSAIRHYQKTGQHLGIFSDEQSADRFAQQLHEQQANEYTSGPFVSPLQKYGVNMDINQVNQHVDEIASAYLKQWGHTPSPGLVFDLLKANGVTGPVNYDQLFGTPTSVRQAQTDLTVRQLAGGSIGNYPVVQPKFKDLLKTLDAAATADKNQVLDAVKTKTPGADSVAYPNITQWQVDNEEAIKAAYQDPKLRDQMTQVLMKQKFTQPQQILAAGIFGNPSALLHPRDVLLPVTQIAEATTNMPYGVYKLAEGATKDAYALAAFTPLYDPLKSLGLHPGGKDTHLFGIGKQMVAGVKYDFENWRTRPGYLAMDIWAGASAGVGTFGRLSAATEAATTEAGVVAKVGGVSRAIVFRPKPAWTDMGYGSYHESVPLADTYIVRMLQQHTPFFGRTARQARLVADQTDGFLPSDFNRRVANSLLGTEKQLRRARESRLQIEMAQAYTPLTEMMRLNGQRSRFMAVAKDIFQHPSTIGDWRALSAKQRIGVEKAVQVVFTDDLDPMNAWRNYHNQEINALTMQKSDYLETQLSSARELNPETKLEEVTGTRNFRRGDREIEYKIQAHQAQLEALDLAEQVILHPPTRFKKFLDRAFEVADQQEEFKSTILGLDRKIAEQRIGEIGARIRFENVVKLGKEGDFEKIISPVDTSGIETGIESATRKLKNARLRYNKAQSTIRLHPGHDEFLPELDNARKAVERHNKTLGTLQKQLDEARASARPVRKLVLENGEPNFKLLQEHVESAALERGVTVNWDPSRINTMEGVRRAEAPGGEDLQSNNYTARTKGNEVLSRTINVHPVESLSDYFTAMHEIGHDSEAFDASGKTGLKQVHQNVPPDLLKSAEWGTKMGDEGTLRPWEWNLEKEALAWNWAIDHAIGPMRTIVYEHARELFATYLPDLADESPAIQAQMGTINVGPAMSKFLARKMTGEMKTSDLIYDLRAGTSGSAFFKMDPQKYRDIHESRFGRVNPRTRYGMYNKPFPFQAFTGKSLEMGDFRWDMSNLLAEQFVSAYHAAVTRTQFDDLWNSAVDSQISPRHMPIRDIKDIPDELREIVQAIERQKLDKNFDKIVNDEKLLALRKFLYPEEGDIQAGDHVKWVDQNLIPNKMGGQDTMFWPTVDRFMSAAFTPLNEPMRIMLIFGTPAYLMNATGAAATLLIQTGFLAPMSFGRALASHHFYGPEVTRLLDRLSGQTHTAAIVSERNLFTKLSQGIQEFWQPFTDTMFRRASVIHELRRNGLLKDHLSQEDLLKSLQDATNSNAVNQASQAARKAMLDFNHMTWAERATLRHIFFVYSFVRASGIWSLRFLRDHGVLADTLALSGRDREKQIIDLVGHMPAWFMRAGYFATHPGVVTNPVQWNMPGMLEQIVSPLEAIFHETPYSSPAELLGPTAVAGQELMTGYDTQGQKLPGSGGTAERTMLALWQQTSWGQVGVKNAKTKRAEQAKIPPPPVKGSFTNPIQSALARERAGSNLPVLATDGFWNTWGLALLRSAEPRHVNRLGGEARYWRDLRTVDPAAYHQHEIDAVLAMVKRQQQVVGETAPIEVMHGVENVAKVSQFIEDYLTKHKGEPSPNPRQLNMITLDALVKQGVITDRAKWTARIKNDPDPTSVNHTRMAMLYTGGGAAWAKWVDKVNMINDYAGVVYGATVQKMAGQGLGDYGSTVSAPRKVKWAYGRRSVKLLEQAQELSQSVPATTGYEQDAARQKWIDFVNRNDKPVTVNGTSFPSPFAYQFATKTPEEQAKSVASFSKRKPSEMTAFQIQLLTGARPDPIVTKGWQTLYGWLAKAKQELPLGQTLQSGTRKYWEDFLASKSPQFKAALTFERAPLANRMQTYQTIKRSPNSEGWSWLLNAAASRAKQLRAIYTNSNGNPNEPLVARYWHDHDVPLLVDSLHQHYPALTSELGLYTGGVNDPKHADQYLDKFLVRLIQP